MSTSAGRVRTRYDFIKAQNKMFPVQVLCRVLDVAPSYYAWLKQPRSNRAQEDARLLRLIRASFVASQGIYGRLACFSIYAGPERRAASTASRG